MHAAGARRRARSLDDLTRPSSPPVAGAKVAGAVHLDELLGDRPLDAFVLFSSIAGVWGSAGQGALRRRQRLPRRARRAAGAPAAWPATRSPGARGPTAAWPTADAAEEHLRRRGLAGAWPRTPALAALRQARRTPATRCVTVADVDWDRFAPRVHRRRGPARCSPTCREVAGADRPTTAAGAADAAGRPLAALGEAEQAR